MLKPRLSSKSDLRETLTQSASEVSDSGHNLRKSYSSGRCATKVTSSSDSNYSEPSSSKLVPKLRVKNPKVPKAGTSCSAKHKLQDSKDTDSKVSNTLVTDKKLKTETVKNKYSHTKTLERNKLKTASTRKKSLSASASKESNCGGGTGSLSVTYPPVRHSYILRSHGQTPAASHCNASANQRRKSDAVDLGATSSHLTTREEQEPSRLTRSGAVLRRSTRNSKGKPSVYLFPVSTHFCMLLCF